MRKEIKVYLQFPWMFIDSPYYRTLVDFPPKNVRYVNIRKRKIGIVESPSKFKLLNQTKKIVRKVAKVVKLPNITYTFPTDVAVIHCAHCLSLNKRPWVVDVEHYWTFSSSGEVSYSERGKKIIKKLLKREHCKKIVPWTYAAKETIVKTLKDKEITRKMWVVYPAIKAQRKKRFKRGKIKLLFLGRHFYSKGGLFVLEIFKRLVRKFDVECIFISATIPEILKKKYENYFTIHRFVSKSMLFNKIYPSCHIFVYPGFGDTFGFAFLEAMSFGLPIITSSGFARDEIVENGKNGFLIERGKINIKKIGNKEEEFIKEFTKRIVWLLNNRTAIKRMGEYGRRLVEKGKFSVKERNKKLREIYEESQV